MREQVEALEDEADLGALAGELAIAQMHEPAVDLLLADQRAVDPDVARGRLLEIVDAAQQRRLARAARADDRQLLAPRDVDADALEDLQRAEALVQVDDPEQRVHDERCAAAYPAERDGGMTGARPCPYPRAGGCPGGVQGLEAVVAARRHPVLRPVDADAQVLFVRRRREPALVAEAVICHHLDVGAVGPDSCAICLLKASCKLLQFGIDAEDHVVDLAT